MTESRVAARYAKSLLDLAQEMGTLPAVADDMRLVAKTLAENRELRLMLTSPVFPTLLGVTESATGAATFSEA